MPRRKITSTAPEGWTPPVLQMLGGYPTESTLRAVKNWPYDKAKELVYALKSVWYYEDYFTESGDCPGIFFASTGGWSGHEELIDAAQQNLMIWNAVYMAYRRGGHYVLSTGYGCYGGSDGSAEVTFEVATVKRSNNNAAPS